MPQRRSLSFGSRKRPVERLSVAVTKYVGVPYFASLKDHPNLKSGAEGPRETETDNPSSLMPLKDRIEDRADVHDVRFWHLADISTAPANVRYWGKRRLTAVHGKLHGVARVAAPWPFMLRSCRCIDLFFSRTENPSS
jgi:hypothetical protein